MFADTPSPIVLLRCKAVLQRTGLTRSCLYALVFKSAFPRPVKITAKAVAWPSDQVDAWMAERIAASKSDS